MSKDIRPFANEQRAKPRITIHAMAVATIDGHRTPTQVYDISANGAQMARVPGAHLGALCELELHGYGVVVGTVVRVEADSFAVSLPFDPQLSAFMADPEELFERLHAMTS